MLKGELDECVAELEESRRKLVNLKMQKDVASGMHTPTHGIANGNLSPEKPVDRTMGLRELKDSIEESKVSQYKRVASPPPPTLTLPNPSLTRHVFKQIM